MEVGWGAVGGRAGIGGDGPAALEGGVAGPDVVNQGAFFADFGEESAGHAAGEDFDPQAKGVVIGVGFGQGRVGDADVGLFGLLGLVAVIAGGGLGLDGEGVAGF